MESRSRTSTTEFLAGDGLRAAAALSVLVFHTTELVAHKQSGGNWLAAYGPVFGRVGMSLNDGLYIFFVLSGYLLSRGFVRAIVEGRPTPSLRRYGAARLLRIVPAFWVLLTVTFLVRGTSGAGAGQLALLYAFGQIYHVQLVNAEIIQAWTLDIEVVFYLLLPLGFLLAARWARTRATPAARAAVLLAAVLLVATASYTGLLLTKGAGPIHINPLIMIFAFTPGIALAIIEPLFAGRLRPSRARLTVPGLVALSLALFAVTCVLPQWSFDARGGVATLAAGCLVGAALARQWSTGHVWWITGNRVSRWVGERSYGIYLWHWFVMLEIAALATRAHAALAVTGATLALSLVAASLSWRLVEQPALRLRRRTAHPSVQVGELPAQPAALA